jgi:hypothetical protein
VGLAVLCALSGLACTVDATGGGSGVASIGSATDASAHEDGSDDADDDDDDDDDGADAPDPDDDDGSDGPDDEPSDTSDDPTDDGGAVGPDCDGEAFVAPAGAWSWVDVPEMKCADGSSTGFAVNPSDRSTSLVIFFMGGGACYDAPSCTPGCNPQLGHCAANLDGYDATTMGQELGFFGPGSLFDRAAADNPVRDFDWVVVPYCTGDMHSGAQQARYGTMHVGYDNIGYMLDHVVPTFCDADRVVLGGASAGGWGSVFNYDRVAQRWAPVRVDLVDDSGPPLGVDMMPLQDTMRASWGSAATAPAGCPACAVGWDAFFPYIATTYPEARMSFVSALADVSVGPFFGGPIASPAGFAAALDSFADDVLAPLPNVRVYYVNAFHHIYTGESLGGTVSAGVSLASFLDAQLADDAQWANVRP